MKQISELDMNSLGFAILCNFPQFCGEERAKEAARILREMKAEIMTYRASGLTPDKLPRTAELVKADEEGLLAQFPFVAMVEQSLQGGKMTPQKDQKFNGRYAVVYMDKEKWASPLIDICGEPYNREQAEAHMAALTRAEAEAALADK